MKEQFLAQLQRLKSMFMSFTPGQKAVTIAAVLGLAIGGYLFSSWAAQPSYAPLFTNLSPTDASAIIDKLNTSKTPYHLTAAGTEIMVPKGQVYPLRLTMSSAGLPTAGSSGYSLLDKEGITTSDFNQQVDYQRALQGELDNTIKSINGVSDANVHLAIPTQNVFADGTDPTTASVLVTTVPGASLTDQQVQSIVNLVSSSVPGLDANQVSVSDQSGHVLSVAGTGVTSGGADDSQTTATQTYEQTLESRAQAMLDKVVGAGNSIVTLNANLDFSKTNSTALVYSSATNAPPLSEAQTSEKLGAGASTSAGVLGATTPTTGASATPTAVPSGGYINTSDTRDNAVNQTTTTTTNAPGEVKNLSVSVVLDKQAAALLTSADASSQVSAAVGLDPKRGDTIAVTTTSFDTSAQTAATAAAAKATKAAAAAKSSAQLISMVKTGGLVLLVIAIFVVSFMFSRRRKNEDPEPDDLDVFLSTLRDDPSSLPAAPMDIVPPPSREVRMSAAGQKQLADMAETDPQEVARLLRTWLNAKDS